MNLGKETLFSPRHVLESGSDGTCQRHRPPTAAEISVPTTASSKLFPLHSFSPTHHQTPEFPLKLTNDPTSIPAGHISCPLGSILSLLTNPPLPLALHHHVLLLVLPLQPQHLILFCAAAKVSVLGPSPSSPSVLPPWVIPSTPRASGTHCSIALGMTAPRSFRPESPTQPDTCRGQSSDHIHDLPQT